jgi:hypothetical protein
MEILKEVAEEYKANMVIFMKHALISKLKDLHSGNPFAMQDSICVYGEDRNSNFCIAQQYKRDKNNEIEFGKKIVFSKGGLV